jgi:cell division septation protein DedD
MNPMGWWRRNWVDTLMITLILLVVGGFVSLLLRGTPGLSATNTTPNPASSASGSTVSTAETNTTTMPADKPASSAGTASAATSNTPTQNTKAPSAATPSTKAPDAKVSSSKAASTNSSSSNPKAVPTDMTRVEPSSVTAGKSTAGKSATSKPDSQAVSANSLNGQNKSDSPQLDSSEPAQATGNASEPAQATGNTTVTLSKAAPKPALPKASKVVETPIAPKPVIQVPAPRPTRIIGATKPVAPRVIQAKPSISSPSRSVYLRSYRVAVGSFSAPSRAEKLAVSLRNEGLPARAIRSGGNTVVIVGPYKTESDAKTAFEQVKSSHSDAILFRPNGSKVRANANSQAAISQAQTAPKPTQVTPEATSSTPAQSSEQEVVASPETPQTSTEATAAPVAPVKPAPLGRYLQVGAFKDIASAGPILAKLAKYGYRGTLDQGSDGLTRVLVGPYDTKTFERAKRNLRNRGFRVFAAK